MSLIETPDKLVASVASDEQIQTLLAVQGLELHGDDRAAVIALARYFLAQSALIAGPLPLETEPMSLHAIWLDTAREPGV